MFEMKEYTIYSEPKFGDREFDREFKNREFGYQTLYFQVIT